MKIIDLYLEEVSRRLPIKNREDILQEIRSTLMDMIEDRQPGSELEPDEDIVKEVLKEFGHPRKVAGQYTQHNYLIGPQIFPAYLQVLKIVLIIATALNVLGVIVALISQSSLGSTPLDAIAGVVSGLFNALFTAFGIVTLSFAGVERTTPEEWKVKIEEDWDPEDLLNQMDKERVKVTEIAIEITLSLVFIVILNFFLDRIGIYSLGETGWISAPILNENFKRYIPWLTACAVLDIGLNLYLIRRGFWDKIAAIIKVLINAFKIAINFVILTGPAIITITASAWQKLNFDAFTAEGLTRGLNIGLDVVLGLAIFGMVVDSIRRLYETFIKGSSPKLEIDVD